MIALTLITNTIAIAEIDRTWLAFVPLTHSVFWGTLAYSLIGWNIRRDSPDPGVLAGVVHHLVQDRTDEHPNTRTRSFDSNGASRIVIMNHGLLSYGSSGLPGGFRLAA
jgi:hypothetical protein